MAAEITIGKGYHIELILNRGIINYIMPDTALINLIADTDYIHTNPFTGNKIPGTVNLFASDGTKILDAYINVNQTTGDITINVGANYSNAILKTIGW
jgi:hypothetical protein